MRSGFCFMPWRRYSARADWAISVQKFPGAHETHALALVSERAALVVNEVHPAAVLAVVLGLRHLPDFDRADVTACAWGRWTPRWSVAILEAPSAPDRSQSGWR